MNVDENRPRPGTRSVVHTLDLEAALALGNTANEIEMLDLAVTALDDHGETVVELEVLVAGHGVGTVETDELERLAGIARQEPADPGHEAHLRDLPSVRSGETGDRAAGGILAPHDRLEVVLAHRQLPERVGVVVM